MGIFEPHGKNTIEMLPIYGSKIVKVNSLNIIASILNRKLTCVTSMTCTIRSMMKIKLFLPTQERSFLRKLQAHLSLQWWVLITPVNMKKCEPQKLRIHN